MESALNGIYTLIIFVLETPWLAMQTCLFSDMSTNLYLLDWSILGTVFSSWT